MIVSVRTAVGRTDRATGRIDGRQSQRAGEGIRALHYSPRQLFRRGQEGHQAGTCEIDYFSPSNLSLHQ